MIERCKDNIEINEDNIQKCTKFFETITGKKVVFTNSATSALFNIIQALDLTETDEVIIQSYAHPAMYNVLNVLGIKYIIAKNNGLMLDIDDAIEKITPNTKAIMYCEVNGFIDSNILKLKKICTEKNICLIEDSAPSLGQTVNGINAGSIGDASVFSFSSSKLFFLGGGGVAALSNSLYDKVKRLTSVIDYNNMEPGNMSLYLSKLLYIPLANHIDHFQEYLDIREKNFNIYKKYLDIYETDGSNTPGACTIFRPENIARKIQNQLKLFKIQSRYLIYPDLIGNTRNEHIDLPFHSELTENNIKLISKIVNSCK